MTYRLQIVEANGADDTFYHFGGADFSTEAEARKELNSLPEFKSTDDIPNRCIVDLLADDGDILADREISAQTVESLLGETIADMREEAKLVSS